MLKKLTALFLSLLLCLSLLPSQAGAMDASKDEQPVQMESMENLDSSNDGDTGDAPCHVSTPDVGDLGGGPGLPIGPQTDGRGKPINPAPPPSFFH